VTEDLTNKEQAIRTRFEESEQRLSDLETKLQGVNDELHSLVDNGHEFEVLAQVCRSLEELENIGAADLFWDSQEGQQERNEKLANAGERIDAYAAEILRTEDRRDAILEDMGGKNQELDQFHYELLDVIEQQERHRNEWLVERELTDVPHHNQVMPWARGNEEDQRFRKSLRLSLAASVCLAIILGSIAIPIVEREQIIEVPERIARLVQQQRAQPEPEPEPQPIFEEELPEPEELVETLPEDTPPEIVEQPAVASNEPVDTKEQVKSKGILAFRDSFAQSSNLRASTQIGSQARFSNAGIDATGRPSRSMVTTNAPGSSGGINLADISRDVGGGGGGIEGVEISRVASSIGTGGSGSSDRPRSGGSFAGRTDEEIQIVFDRYKASLYRLYNRELRKDPTLRGQVILKLTIEPDGTVSFCILQASDMNAPALAQQVVERVIGFDFGAKEDIVAVTIIYPIDFLPAA
jgi:outer membrane biosynthesis protein TonB